MLRYVNIQRHNIYSSPCLHCTDSSTKRTIRTNLNIELKQIVIVLHQYTVLDCIMLSRSVSNKDYHSTAKTKLHDGHCEKYFY